MASPYVYFLLLINTFVSILLIISFVAHLTSDRVQFVKFYPEGNAQTRLSLRGGWLYFYCNRHGLMKRKV